MPYFFLSEETATKLSEHIELEIFSLENQISEKKEALERLKKPINNESEIAGHGRIMPQELGENPGTEIIPVPQSSDSSAPGSPETKKLEPLKLTKADLTIPKFPHDKKQEKSFRTLFYLEMPDGRVVLKYMSNLLHTTKDIISKLPYPMPNGHLKKSGLTANQITAIRLYQKFLYASKITDNTQKNTVKKPEEPEDWKYKKILNTNTRPNLDEEKVEGCLE